MKTWPLVVLAACGATRPSPKPPLELWGEGTFTTDAWDFFVAFSPDQRRALFGRADDAFERFTLLETRLGDDGRWSPPAPPPFATAGSNADPHFSPDGRRVLFISDRPGRATHDIFTATLGDDGTWSDATRLPAPVNDPTADEWSPAVAASGNLYFGGERAGTRGGSDLWVSRVAGGVYQPPENLGGAINTAAHEVEPWIAPDESYLIFSALRREGGAGGYDLFLSRRTATGWSRAEPLHAVNTAAAEWNHSVTPDGRWLHLTSDRRGGKGDMYRIAMEEIMSPPTTVHRPVSIAPGGASALAYEVAGAARTLYISGQIPVASDDTVPDGFEAQCRQVWAHIDQQLAATGMDRRDLVKVTTFLADRAYRADNSRIRRELLGEHLPALTVIIADIYDPAWLLEIEAVAAR